jgi:hypothetical protein
MYNLYEFFLMLNEEEKMEKRNNKMKYPDAKKHQQISFIKSGIRIIGYIFIPLSLVWATIFLVISEVVGIYEELV